MRVFPESILSDPKGLDAISGSQVADAERPKRNGAKSTVSAVLARHLDETENQVKSISIHFVKRNETFRATVVSP